MPGAFFMNYRHHFHAGNFADVMKHLVLVQLVRGLQRKEKGFLCLDTHAGRGGYDLSVATAGDSLARQPEFPDGIGRIWATQDAPSAVLDYVELVRAHHRECGGEAEGAPRFYPGSPALLKRLARPQERLVFCEKHPEEYAELDALLGGDRQAEVRMADGYAAVRAVLPPLERRALVLIDPPFEAQNEFSLIVGALRDGLKRLPGGTFAVWYPLTERAKLVAFYSQLRELDLPPTLVLELLIAGEESERKLKGCAMLVLNPPWRILDEVGPAMRWLGQRLAVEPGGGANVTWLVPER